MNIWLVQYRYERERSFEHRAAPGDIEQWRISPFKPATITEKAAEGDLVAIWRTVDSIAPEGRTRDDGGIVGWGRLRLSKRDEGDDRLSFEVTHFFPTSPIARSQVHATLGLNPDGGAKWPGQASLRLLNDEERN
ncbi:MAG: hypothetical protein AAFP78_08185, partial [Pseudomonadota bacterium]